MNEAHWKCQTSTLTARTPWRSKTGKRSKHGNSKLRSKEDGIHLGQWTWAHTVCKTRIVRNLQAGKTFLTVSGDWCLQYYTDSIARSGLVRMTQNMSNNSIYVYFSTYERVYLKNSQKGACKSTNRTRTQNHSWQICQVWRSHEAVSDSPRCGQWFPATTPFTTLPLKGHLLLRCGYHVPIGELPYKSIIIPNLLLTYKYQILIPSNTLYSLYSCSTLSAKNVISLFFPGLFFPANNAPHQFLVRQCFHQHLWRNLKMAQQVMQRKLSKLIPWIVISLMQPIMFILLIKSDSFIHHLNMYYITFIWS